MVELTELSVGDTVYGHIYFETDYGTVLRVPVKLQLDHIKKEDCGLIYVFRDFNGELNGYYECLPSGKSKKEIEYFFYTKKELFSYISTLL